jgi:hypothetical protein
MGGDLDNAGYQDQDANHWDSVCVSVEKWNHLGAMSREFIAALFLWRRRFIRSLTSKRLYRLFNRLVTCHFRRVYWSLTAQQKWSEGLVIRRRLVERSCCEDTRGYREPTYVR